MNKYAVEGVVGEGAYGVVLKCRNKVSNEIVAVKKFKECEEDDVVRKTTLREVKILRMLKHPCVVDLREAFRRKGKLYLVFEYMENNLLEVLEENPNGLDPETVRRYIFQLTLAIEFCHRHGVIHRDIKPENLLVNRAGKMKLCDFGFARTVTAADVGNLTDYVATRWYRSPELLLGTQDYGFRVDVWAIGCIMAELLDGQPLFAGDTEIDQLYVIQKTLGPLPPSQMDIFQRNKRFAGTKFGEIRKVDTFTKRFSRILSKKGLAFMKSVVQLEPDRRLSSLECVNHPYFDGLKEEFGVEEYFKESRPKSAAIASQASTSNSVMAPVSSTPAISTALPMAAAARPTAVTATPSPIISATTAAISKTVTPPRDGRSSSFGVAEEVLGAHDEARKGSNMASSLSRQRVATEAGRGKAPVDPEPAPVASKLSRSKEGSKDSKPSEGSKRGRVVARTISVDEKDRFADRSKSREPSKGPSSRGVVSKADGKDGTKRGSSLAASKPPVALMSQHTVMSSVSYAIGPSGAAIIVPDAVVRHRLGVDEAAERLHKLRDDADDFDNPPIPVAASAHIHAAAARAVGGFAAADDTPADFDVVEHYIATRPTSGIRPRSGVRTTAVNPALAAIRNSGNIAVSSAAGSSSHAVKRSPVASAHHDDYSDAGKLQEDEPPPSRGTASHSRSSKRTNVTRGMEPLAGLSALPAVGNVGVSYPPLGTFGASHRDEAADRQAKLAADRDDGHSVPAPKPGERNFKQSDYYVAPIPAFRK